MVHSDPQTALTSALIGHWTGILEYRDYSEPATSAKRVLLPTWLSISPGRDGLSLDYTYDDGPGKTVNSHDTLVLRTETRTYQIRSKDGSVDTYTIGGLEQLKDGRGTVILSGPGTDNSKAAEIRTTWTIERNLLSWLEEVRRAGSSEPFAFRHRYTFTRAEAPAVTQAAPK